MKVRHAEERDLARLTEINNHYILNSHATSSQYRDHLSFDQTVETSVYISAAQKSKGIALPNDGSAQLHKKFGFEEVGVFKEYAQKRGERISSLWMQKWIGDQ